jgi:hypothetical protein
VGLGGDYQRTGVGLFDYLMSLGWWTDFRCLASWLICFCIGFLRLETRLDWHSRGPSLTLSPLD